MLNEKGQASPLPAAPTGENLSWEDETALDVEMIWAICPNCHIDLFEANSSFTTDLGTAENSAAKVTKFISNSWSNADYPGENVYDSMYFSHPGVAMSFASGDYGFGATYPGSSGLVTSVGGTYLTNSSDSRGYTESVWAGQSTGPGTGTAAGCSSGEGKPSWQTDTGCTNRTQNDVAAVADAPYGIDVYSSSGDCDGYTGAFGEDNDCAVYGTSVATPIITATYALAGTPELDTYPVSYLYQHAGTTDFNRVTSGHIGTCESTRLYLCNAADSLSNGYNGPTGLGTPNGVGAFTPATGDIVSVVNPGSYDLQAGSHYSLPAIKAYDSASGPILTYSASELPSGFTINSATGAISGTLSATPVNRTVKVTVKEGAGGTGASATISFGIATVKAMSTDYHADSGQVKLDLDDKCMNDGYNDTHVDAPISIYTCGASASETWSYAMPQSPGNPGRITVHGKCLYVLGSKNSAGYRLVGLATCNYATGELWELVGYAGEIYNPASGDCLSDPKSSKTNSTQLTVQPCTGGYNQAWMVPASPVTSGLAGKCLAASAGAAISTSCSTSTSQRVTLGLDGSLQFGNECLYNAGGGINDGTAIKEYACPEGPTSTAELWSISAYGQIQNLVSQKCLAVPNNSSANGAKLELEDCYGEPGEVWAVS